MQSWHKAVNKSMLWVDNNTRAHLSRAELLGDGAVSASDEACGVNDRAVSCSAGVPCVAAADNKEAAPTRQSCSNKHAARYRALEATLLVGLGVVLGIVATRFSSAMNK
jgi:hypothetical protein